MKVRGSLLAGAGMGAVLAYVLDPARGARRRAVDVQKTIVVNASLNEVYAFWSLYENFPKFMSRVLDVRSGERRPMQSHWRVAGLEEGLR